MVEPAEADVIGPAIAADDPDRTAYQVIDNRKQLPGVRIVLQGEQFGLEGRDPLALRADLGLADLRRREDRACQIVAKLRQVDVLTAQGSTVADAVRQMELCRVRGKVLQAKAMVIGATGDVGAISNFDVSENAGMSAHDNEVSELR